MHDDAYIGGHSENNIKCVVHDDLGRKNQTTRYILPRHWLYEWFSQFYSCGTYSVLSWSHSIVIIIFFLLWHSDSSLSRLCWKLAVKKWFVVIDIWRYLHCCLLFRLPDSSFSVTDIEHCLGKLLTIPCSYVLLKHLPLWFVSDYTFLFLIIYYHHFFSFFCFFYF